MVCSCIRACLLVVSVCSLGYFRRFWVFVVYGLVEFAMQLGEVCKMFFSVAFGGSVLDGR